MGTVRIKSSHAPSQGPFVTMDERDFDPAVHQLSATPPPAARYGARPAAKHELGHPRPRAQRKP